MLRVLAAFALLLSGCGGNSSPGDGPLDLLSADQGVLVFPDLSAGDGNLAPRDAAGSDHPELPDAGLPTEGGAADLGSGDQLPADLSSPDTASAPCGAYSEFTCTTGFLSCQASCTTGWTTVSISCITLSNSCTCTKNGVNLGTCASTGTGCTVCGNAFSCCQGLF